MMMTQAIPSSHLPNGIMVLILSHDTKRLIGWAQTFMWFLSISILVMNDAIHKHTNYHSFPRSSSLLSPWTPLLTILYRICAQNLFHHSVLHQSICLLIWFSHFPLSSPSYSIITLGIPFLLLSLDLFHFSGMNVRSVVVGDIFEITSHLRWWLSLSSFTCWRRFTSQL